LKDKKKSKKKHHHSEEEMAESVQNGTLDDEPLPVSSCAGSPALGGGQKLNCSLGRE